MAVFRRFIARRIQAINNIAFVVAQHHFSAVLSVQAAFACQLQAFLAFAVDIGKADHMGKQIAHRIMALAFMLESQAFDVQSGHLLADFRWQLALQIHKIPVFTVQAFGKGCLRHINQGRQLRQLLRCGQLIHARRHGIKRIGGGADGQGGTVAIGDGAAGGGERQGAHKALVAFFFQKRLLFGLQIHTTTHQGHKRHTQPGQHQHDAAIGGHRFVVLGLLGQHLRLVVVFD